MRKTTVMERARECAGKEREKNNHPNAFRAEREHHHQYSCPACHSVMECPRRKSICDLTACKSVHFEVTSARFNPSSVVILDTRK